MGYLTTLLDKLKPAIVEEKITLSERNGNNISFVNNVSGNNVKLTIQQIRNRSKILLNLELNRKINIVGALYDIETGKVKFYEHIPIKNQI
jgi:carbonic anhydrase